MTPSGSRPDSPEHPENPERVDAGPVLWCGTVRTKSFPERVRAATSGGFASMSMFPADHRRFRDGGLTDADLRSRLGDAGLRVRTLDPFSRWLPTFAPPASMAPGDVEFVGTGEADFLAAATALGVQSVTVIEPFGNPVTTAAATESFAGFCDRAAERGLDVHLEFIPWSGIPDLATAWEIVRDAGRDNGGIVLDLWHYFRGRRDDALLHTIPGDRIFTVQVSDGDREVRGSLYDDFSHYRRAPGRGGFDLTAVLRILADTGGLSSVGAEIFADDFDAMRAEDAGRTAGETLRAVLAPLDLPDGRAGGPR